MESETQNIISPQDPKAELDQLAKHLTAVRRNIAEQRDQAARIEERIAALVGVKEEGTISQKTSQWKVTTTGGLTRALELHNPQHFKMQLGAERFDDLIRVKLSLNLAEFRKASVEEQKILAEHMIVKPKKVTVKIEPREEA